MDKCHYRKGNQVSGHQEKEPVLGPEMSHARPLKSSQRAEAGGWVPRGNGQCEHEAKADGPWMSEASRPYSHHDGVYIAFESCVTQP